MRLLALMLLTVGCGPTAERADLFGLWGRVVDGEHDVWELRERIDATGLTEVTPAFRRYRYPLDDIPLQVARGRWEVLSGELILTPSWSLDQEEINRTVVWEVQEWDERGLELLPPDTEEPIVLGTLQALPEPSPE